MNSNYDALSGGVSAWGLGGMGAVRRGGFGSSGALGGVQYPNAAGFTIDSNGYLVSNADGSLWVYSLDNDGVNGLDPTTGYYLIEAA